MGPIKVRLRDVHVWVQRYLYDTIYIIYISHELRTDSSDDKYEMILHVILLQLLA